MKADFQSDVQYIFPFSDIDIFYTRISSLPLNQGILLVFWLVSFGATPYLQRQMSNFEHGTSPEYDLDIENTKNRRDSQKKCSTKIIAF